MIPQRLRVGKAGNLDDLLGRDAVATAPRGGLHHAAKARRVLQIFCPGAASHLCGLLFMSAIQADLTTVPYKGTAPAINDLLGGQVDLLCDQTTNTTSYIKSGRIKAYAVTSKARVPSLPDLPPAAEAGLPGFEVSVWHGVYAPKGTPKPVIDRLVAALQAGIADPAFGQKMAELGSVVVSKDKATPEGLRNHLKAEIDKWTPIIRKAGVYAD